jgi:hypothetical protein
MLKDSNLTLAASISNERDIVDIKTFDGEKSEWPTFAIKMKMVRKIQDNAAALKTLWRKLGSNPLHYLESVPGLVTYDDVMDALRSVYDPLGDPIDAYLKFSRLQQGGSTLLKHNTHVCALLNKTGRSLTAEDPGILSIYINSLSDPFMRRKLHGRLQAVTSKGKSMSISDLMQQSRECEKLNERVNQTDVDPIMAVNSVTNQMASMDVNAVNAQRRPYLTGRRTGIKSDSDSTGGGDGTFKKPVFCEIHESPSHPTEKCNDFDATNCRYCHLDLTVSMKDHTKDCEAKRCFKCNRRGHRAAECRSKGNSRGVKRGDRQQGGSNTGKKVNTVETATPETTSTTASPAVSVDNNTASAETNNIA